jgi:hypothetical protein
MRGKCSTVAARAMRVSVGSGCRRICAMLLPALEMLQGAGVGGGAVSGAVQGVGLLSTRRAVRGWMLGCNVLGNGTSAD